MTQQTFIVDYGLTIIGGNSISGDTGFTTITGDTGVELVATGVDSGAYVGVEDTISSYMLAGNATAASNIVVSLDQVLTSTTGNVQLNVGDNTWLFDTAPLDPTEAYLYVPGGAAITTPNATGGGGGKNIFIEAGAADQSNFYTTAGGELMLKGGRGAFNDGGGGGPGGNVNINAGESADPAGVAGNVYITAGALQNWTFDNTGNLTLPSNSFTVNYANGTPVSVGSGYGDSNVVTLLSSFGSNTVSTTGNITAGNIGVGRVTATANISTTGFFISGNQATGGFQLGNVNSRIQVGGGNSYMTFGQNPAIYPDTAASAFAGVLIGGNGYLLAPNGSRVLTLQGTGNVDVTSSLNLPNGGQVVTTGNASFGNINSSGSITRSGNFAQPAWTTSGIGLKIPVATYTDTTTAAGTLAASYTHVLAAPTLSFSNAVTVTNAATLHVTSPTAGTNATLANAWAIMVSSANNSITASGNVLFTGGFYANSINAYPGENAASGQNGTYNVFSHSVLASGYKYLNIGTGQTISSSNTQIYLGSQYGICNTTVYGNFVAANAASFSNTATITTSNYAIGYRDIPQITFSANANAALTDAGKHYYSTTAGNLALTLPNNTTTAFPVGTAMTVVVQAAGNVLVNAGTGVTLYLGGSSTAGNRVVGPYGMATLMKVAANVWFINGTGVY